MCSVCTIACVQVTYIGDIRAHTHVAASCKLCTFVTFVAAYAFFHNCCSLYTFVIFVYDMFVRVLVRVCVCIFVRTPVLQKVASYAYLSHLCCSAHV